MQLKQEHSRQDSFRGNKYNERRRHYYGRRNRDHVYNNGKGAISNSHRIPVQPRAIDAQSQHPTHCQAQQQLKPSPNPAKPRGKGAHFQPITFLQQWGELWGN
jgi:hypothetical protein